MARKTSKNKAEEVPETEEEDVTMEEETVEETVEEDTEMHDEGEEEEEEEEEEESILADKFSIVSTGPIDPTAVTFCFKEEDHTLGNALRHMVNKNPQVDFCGYSIPHPSEAKMHIRLQTTDKTTALDALMKGMNDLYDMCAYINEAYEEALARKDYEIVDHEVA